jgi:hypothetical protein
MVSATIDLEVEGTEGLSDDSGFDLDYTFTVTDLNNNNTKFSISGTVTEGNRKSIGSWDYDGFNDVEYKLERNGSAASDSEGNVEIHDSLEQTFGGFAVTPYSDGSPPTETLTWRVSPPPFTLTDVEGGTEVSVDLSNYGGDFSLAYDTQSQIGDQSPEYYNNYANTDVDVTRTGGSNPELLRGLQDNTTYYYTVYAEAKSDAHTVLAAEQTFTHTEYNFSPTIDSTTSPVFQGDLLDVTTTITNNGSRDGTQTVKLLINGTQEDSVSVTLNQGASTTKTLSWDTSGAAGDYTAKIQTLDESASTTVTVETGYDIYIDGTQVKDITIDGTTITGVTIDGNVL